MKNIFNKLKADPRKAVGTIFLSVGVFICLVALLFLGVRAIRIERIKNSVEKIAYLNGRVRRVENDEIEITYISGCLMYSMSDRKYISTAFGVRQDDRVMVYYEPFDHEKRILVDILDKNWRPVVVEVGIWSILVGSLLCAVGIIILLRDKVLLKIWGAIFLSVGTIICLSAPMLLGVRYIRIKEMENSAKIFSQNGGQVASIQDGVMYVSVGPGPGAPHYVSKKYVSTGFPIKPLDCVIVYYDKNISGSYMVVDLVDPNGNPAIVNAVPWILFAGAMFSAVGVISLIRAKGIVEQSTDNQNDEE